MADGVSDAALEQLAARLGEALLARGVWLTTAESCTGGWLGQVITAIPGSSAWYERGYITYSNSAKQQLLGVRDVTLARHGAVSEAVVNEMAEGALRAAGAGLALAISGIAGPGGGSVDKPVGTVCFASALAGGGSRATTWRFAGDREAVRRQAVAAALRAALDRLAEPVTV